MCATASSSAGAPAYLNRQWKSGTVWVALSKWVALSRHDPQGSWLGSGDLERLHGYPILSEKKGWEI